MKASNYKIIDERTLSQTEVLKGMDFEHVLKIKPVSNVALKTWIFGGVVVLGVVAGAYLFVNNDKKEIKNDQEPKVDSVIHAIKTELKSEKKEELKITKKTETVQLKDTVSNLGATSKVEEENDDNYSPSEAREIKSVKFKVRFNTDAETAITIKDSIYGPTNVSLGKGDYCEFKHSTIEKAVEKNSAWFKFDIKKDTLLTLHIVPTLKSDDYDFALFKCDNYNCMRDLKLGKLKPVTFCYSWNSSENPNTGLSRRNKDTTFQMEDYGGRHGRTYAGAIRVKAGETYYLMVNNSLALSREPDGFMIYFYNYLPKSKANQYSTSDPNRH
jgi:hypothetical protein